MWQSMEMQIAELWAKLTIEIALIHLSPMCSRVLIVACLHQLLDSSPSTVAAEWWYGFRATSFLASQAQQVAVLTHLVVVTKLTFFIIHPVKLIEVGPDSRFPALGCQQSTSCWRRRWWRRRVGRRGGSGWWRFFIILHNWSSCRGQGCLVQGRSSFGFGLLCQAAMTTALVSRSFRTWQTWVLFRRTRGQLQLDFGLASVGGDRQGSLPAILLNPLEDLKQIGQLVPHSSFSQNLK